MSSRKTLVKFRETDEEEYDVEPTKTVKKRKSSSSGKGKSKASGSSKALFVMLFVIIVLLGITVFLLYKFNGNALKNFLSNQLSVTVDKVTVDTSTLRQKKTKFVVDLRLKNESIYGYFVESVVFDIYVGNSKLTEKTLSAKINYNMSQNEDIKVPVVVSVDSILAKRALQKSVEKNATEVIKMILKNTHLTNEAFNGDIRAVTSINGKVFMHLSVFGFEIPFEKEFKHN